jgi:hypothetical protein
MARLIETSSVGIGLPPMHRHHKRWLIRGHALNPVDVEDRGSTLSLPTLAKVTPVWSSLVFARVLLVGQQFRLHILVH